MRAREFIVEYDRGRAAAAVGENLWKAMLRDKFGFRVSLANFAAELEQKQPTAFKQIGHIFTDPNAQKKLIDQALEELEQADPTANKKYTQWLARMFVKDPPVKLEDIKSTAAEYLAKFNKLGLKKMLKPEHSDLNRFKSLTDFMSVVDQYELPDDSETKAGNADKLYSDSDVTIIHPKDEAAACQYGRQTRWCTAATKGQNYFNNYNKQGPLYILIPKNPQHQGEKYQLHFPSDQFMDEDDEEVQLNHIFERFPNVREFFIKHEPEAILNSLQAIPDNELETLLEKIEVLVTDQIDNLITKWRDEDKDYINWVKDMEYVDDEGDIDWEKAPSYREFNPEVDDMYEDMTKAVSLSPEDLKDFAQELEDEIGEEYKKVNTIPEVYIHHVEYNIGNEELKDALTKILERIKLKLQGDTWVPVLVKQRNN